jgi:hypothetical protein
MFRKRILVRLVVGKLRSKSLSWRSGKRSRNFSSYRNDGKGSARKLYPSERMLRKRYFLNGKRFLRQQKLITRIAFKTSDQREDQPDLRRAYNLAGNALDLRARIAEEDASAHRLSA